MALTSSTPILITIKIIHTNHSKDFKRMAMILKGKGSSRSLWSTLIQSFNMPTLLSQVFVLLSQVSVLLSQAFVLLSQAFVLLSQVSVLLSQVSVLLSQVSVLLSQVFILLFSVYYAECYQLKAFYCYDTTLHTKSCCYCCPDHVGSGIGTWCSSG